MMDEATYQCSYLYTLVIRTNQVGNRDRVHPPLSTE
jgi:hypothetical protein